MTLLARRSGEMRLVGIGLFESSWHLVSLKFSLNDSLDTELYVLRTDGVGDEDAEGLRACFILVV